MSRFSRLFANLFGSKPSSHAEVVRRHQTCLGVHALEAREVPTVVASVVPDGSLAVLRLTGGSQAEAVTITSDGHGGISLSGDVAGTTTATNIDRIEGDLGGGNDRVTFNQGTATSFVTQTKSLAVKLDLGDGDDRFTANLHGALNGNKTLSVEVNGDTFLGGDNLIGGIDVIQVNAGTTNADNFDVKSGATLQLKMTGGGTADTLGVNYEGKLDGLLVLDMSGGNGNDTLTVSADPDTGSGGELRGVDLFGGVAPASIRGDGGNDHINFNFNLRDTSTGTTTASAFVSLDGGWSLFDNDVLSVTGRHPGSVIRIANFEQIV